MLHLTHLSASAPSPKNTVFIRHILFYLGFNNKNLFARLICLPVEFAGCGRWENY